ncbi:hypothetical protein ACI8AC_20375 [Geodermatophilus sp. SYSU D00758]
MAERTRHDRESVMAGHGFYGRHAQPQHRAAAAGYGWLAAAAAAVPVPGDPQPLLVADMGCADGRNEMEPVGLVVDRVRERHPAVPVEVVHTDLPGNDFAPLFELLAGPDGYPAGREHVFPSVVGRTLYGPLVPARRLVLGWCAITLHWLSAVPVDVPGHVYPNLLPPGPAREAIRARAAADWRTFLRERARELVDRGELVLVSGASTPEGTSGAEGLFTMVGEQLARMVDDGALRRAEAERMYYPTWNRTPAEWLDPLASDPDYEVVDAGMSAVDDAETHPQFAVDGDAAAFAAAYEPFVRAVTERPLFRWLDPARPPEERAQVVETFYAGLRDRLAADPPSATCRWHVMALRLRRRPRTGSPG